ncbi:ankyrin repeat-containing domain protein [Xylariaceae sp. FL0804]|nr:ankyrin repeat-containing domain protein [Xylariaceae sp. FL0804]
MEQIRQRRGPTLLDLPLELIRPIIYNAVTATELCYSIKIRQVNKLFDDEVMLVIENEELLRFSAGGKVLRPTTRGIARVLQSDFMATYLLRRPHQQYPWNTNISSFLNALVDRLLALDDIPLDSHARYPILLALCRVARQKAHHITIVPFLFMSQEAWQEMPSFDYSLLQAQIITGRPVLDCHEYKRIIDENLRLNSYVLGTFLNSAIWGKQYALARHILQESRIRHSYYPIAAVSQTLQAAILNDDLQMVQLLLEPAWRYPAVGPDFETTLTLAIRLGRSSIAEFLLNRAGNEPMYHVSHDGLREACFNGDIRLVRHILDRHDDICLDSDQICASNCRNYPDFFGDWRATPVEVAAKQGHGEILELLIAKGANPYGLRYSPDFTDIEAVDPKQAGSFCCAACGGHTGIAKILQSNGVTLHPEQWKPVIRCAIEFGHVDFLRFFVLGGSVDIENFLRHHMSVVQELMAMFSRYGNAEAIRLFAEKGTPVDGPFYSTKRTPMMVALAFEQRHLIQVLLELGATAVHLEQAPHRESFESDEFLMGRAPLLMHPGSRAGVSY